MFYNEKTETRLVVHGDEFTFLGYEDELMEIKTKMEQRYDIKLQGFLGDDASDLREITILNRTIRWDGYRIVYTADGKHAHAIIEDMGLRASSTSVV